MTSSPPSTWKHSSERASSGSAVGLAVLTVLLAIPVLFISVLAFSPTQCPVDGGPFLCRYPSMQGRSWAILAVGFAVSVGLAAASGLDRLARRGTVLRVASVVLTTTLIVSAAVLAASTW